MQPDYGFTADGRQSGKMKTPDPLRKRAKRCRPERRNMNDQLSSKEPSAAQTLPETGSQEAVNKRQAQIVKKASRLFIKKGYAQTTMRDISKATGINLGNLYNYISSKEDILCLAFETYHDPAVAWLERKGVLDIEDPKEQLQTALHQILIMTHDAMNDILMMTVKRVSCLPNF
jgi:AcrR family transcriptional regulator